LQFLCLDGDQTLLQAAAERLLPVVPAERVFVATGPAYAALVAEQLPMLPPENILVEPAGHGTAPSIGLAALHLRRRDPDAVMVVIGANSCLDNAEQLSATLLFGGALAELGHLVVLGVEPAGPSAERGYIQRGAPIEWQNDLAAHSVSAFAEKPDAARARGYLASGDYLWSAGMFVWRADRILEELSQHRPTLAQALASIDTALDTPEQQAALDAAWVDVEDAAIGPAVLEQTRRAVVIPCALGLREVGDWASFADLQQVDEYGNAVVGAHIGLNTYDSLIYSDKRVVATVGVTELLVVDTDDVLLICPRSRVQDVAAIVAQVREQHEHLL
jgi:mannose-1-phosphate guanylyltransferase